MQTARSQVYAGTYSLTLATVPNTPGPGVDNPQPAVKIYNLFRNKHHAQTKNDYTFLFAIKQGFRSSCGQQKNVIKLFGP